MTYSIRLLVVVGLVASAAASRVGAAYVFEEFEAPGFRGPVPIKINNQDVVAGYGVDLQTNKTTGLLYNLHTRQVSPIAVRGACSTLPLGLNDLEHVVGVYYTGDCEENTRQHAFYRDSRGKLYTIDIPEALFTTPESVDRFGAVVGAVLFDDEQQGFIMHCREGRCTAPFVFQAPGDRTFLTIVRDINNRFALTGEFLDHPEANRQFGFVISPRGFTTVHYPGALGSALNGMNDSLDEVGFWYGAEPRTHSFLLRRGVFSSFDPPGATSSSAHDINNSGKIIGIASTVGGYFGWLGSPTS